jgi:DMSO/TMAO reductase YedYZ molybdopterin-dependent catalytic subunit
MASLAMASLAMASLAMASLAMASCVLVAGSLIAQDSTKTGASAATISITGDVPHPLTLSATDIAAMPRRTVQAAEHGQAASTYEGVALSDILTRAGVAFGSALHGPALATYVLCSAADGYHVVFTLAELDSAFSDRPIIVVDRKDGRPLEANAGPFRIVVPGDARPARWIRQLTGIAVVRAADRTPTPH